MLLHIKDNKFRQANVKAIQWHTTSQAMDYGESSIKCTWGEFLSQRHSASSEEGFFLPPVAVRLHLSFTWVHHWTILFLTWTWKKKQSQEKDLLNQV